SGFASNIDLSDNQSFGSSGIYKRENKVSSSTTPSRTFFAYSTSSVIGLCKDSYAVLINIPVRFTMFICEDSIASIGYLFLKAPTSSATKTFALRPSIRFSEFANGINLDLVSKHLTSPLTTWKCLLINGDAEIACSISFLIIDDSSLSGATE